MVWFFELIVSIVEWLTGVSSSSGHHHSHEFLVVDMPIPIDISLSDHFIHLFVSQFLSQVGHHVSQFSSRNESISISIEHLKGFDKFLFCVSILHFSIYETDSTWPSETKTQGSQSFHYRRHQLRWSCLEVQLQLGSGPENAWQCRVPEWGMEYLSGDRAVSVFVEKSKGFFELCDLFFVKLVGHRKPINLKYDNTTLLLTIYLPDLKSKVHPTSHQIIQK